MKTITAILGSVLILCSFGLAQAQTQTQTKNEKKTLSQVVDSAVKRVEGDFIPAAEAMSEEKYGFAPTNGEFKGVRTFAEPPTTWLRHSSLAKSRPSMLTTKKAPIA